MVINKKCKFAKHVLLKTPTIFIETTKMVINKKCKFAKHVLLKTPTIFIDLGQSNSSINIFLCNLWEINEDEKKSKNR